MRKTEFMQQVEKRLGEPIEKLLERLYIDEKKSGKEIAKELGLNEFTVYKYLQWFKIPRRSLSDALKGRKLSKTHKEHLKHSLKGRKILWGDKISKASKGKKKSEEHRRRTSIGLKEYYKTHDPWNKGKKLPSLTDEHKLKISKANKGRPLKEETKKKLSIINKGKRLSPDTMFKKGHPLYRSFTEEDRRKCAEANRRFYLSKDELNHLYHDRKLSTLVIAKKSNVTEGTVSNWLKRYNLPIRTASEATALCWKRHSYADAQMKSRNIKPNKPERALTRLIDLQNLPFRYVGNGSLRIGGLNPDFVSTDDSKRVIELFGEVYHDPSKAFFNIRWKQQYWGRMIHYSQLGYDCLIIWDYELRDEERVLEKLKEFSMDLYEGLL